MKHEKARSEGRGLTRRYLLSAAFAGLLLPVLWLPSAEGAALDTARLEARLAELTRPLAGATGVAAQLVDGGPRVVLNGEEPFPMASTYKVPMAVALLDRVDRGAVSLDQMVAIAPDEMMAGSGDIAKNFVHPGVVLSVANLIEAMITESDNSATDKCLELAGGPAAVTQKLRSLGIQGQRVDRYTGDLLQDFYGLEGLASAAAAREMMRTDPGFAARIPMRSASFEADPRDQSTPIAMLELLLAIDSRSALRPDSREFLLGSLSRTRTASSRLGGLLPRGTPVAHKSGTVGGVANDVGYITLADGRRLAIAVFTKGSDTPPADRDRAIAEVARTLYEVFSSPPASGS